MNPYLLKKPSKLRRVGRPKAIDLFSGAGGITLGLANAGFDVVYCSDRNEACARTHRRNFPNIPFVLGDVEKLRSSEILQVAGLEPGELDLLIGGPPCQGFSIIGQREIWDTRNGLFREFLRLATELQPRCVVIENVPGLATLGKGAVLREIGDAFADAGYVVECAELLAAQYGVPQMRWRMFFIGWRVDEQKQGGFPLPTHGRRGIGDLVQIERSTPKTVPALSTSKTRSVIYLLLKVANLAWSTKSRRVGCTRKQCVTERQRSCRIITLLAFQSRMLLVSSF